MEISNILGLSDPLCKLIDVCSNGISALSAPWMYSRMEKARLKIQALETTQNREIAIKDALTEQLKEDVLSGRDRREWKNVIDVLEMSSNILKCIPEVENEPVNPDWSARFFDYAKNSSDDEVKQLWAQILAGEIKSPGSFSLRTLDVLRNMSKSDAALIMKNSHRVYSGDFIDTDLSVFDLAQLGDIGFINDNSLVRYLNLVPNTDSIIYSDSNYVLICNTPIQKKITYNFHALTQPGREIMTLISIKTDDAFLQSFSNEIIEKLGTAKISKHKILSINGNTYSYLKKQEWEIRR